MKCDKCNGNVVFVRKYSGESLCSECFSDSIIIKTKRTITKYKMIERDDLVCVAVSGGKDSLALLYVLNKLSKKINFKIKAITIDEGIEKYRDEALNIVHMFCNKLKIEHKVYSYKKLFDLTLDEALLLRDNKKSSCSICGVLRRRSMDHAAKDIGSKIIATGHNLDDMIQTFMINIISGDMNKIGFMYPGITKTEKRIKPFCEIYESEIVFFAFINNIPFQSEPCPHMDEGIRTKIREFINMLEKNHYGIKNNVYRSILKIANTINSTQHVEKNNCLMCGNLCTNQICSVCKTVNELKPNANITFSSIQSGSR